jgi:hypothetical protein
LGNDEIVVVINRSDKLKTIKVPVKYNGEYLSLLSGENKGIFSTKNEIKLNLEPLTAVVLKKK